MARDLRSVRLAPAGHVISRRVEDEVLLLDVEGGEYFSLEGVGSRVWELCDGSRDVTEVVGVIVDEYDADPDRIEADILELIAELEDAGLVRSC